MKIKVILVRCGGGFGGYLIKQITGAITVFVMNTEAFDPKRQIKELGVKHRLTEEEAKALVQDEKYIVTVK